jgi:hypothetical protein
VLRQRLSLAGQPATVVRVRRPHWADAVTAVDATGAPLPLAATDGWCATPRPVNEVEFIFAGGVYAEDRRCGRLPDGPPAGRAVRARPRPEAAGCGRQVSDRTRPDEARGDHAGPATHRRAFAFHSMAAASNHSLTETRGHRHKDALAL